MFECDKCDKTFQGAAAASTFAVHEKRKHDPGVYRCHARGCPCRTKAFHWKSDLLQHIRGNHPDLPPSPGWKKCGQDGCQEEYSKFQTSMLKEHMKRHHQKYKRATETVAAAQGDGNETIDSPMIPQAKDESAGSDEQQSTTAPPMASETTGTPVDARRDTTTEAQ